MGGGYKVILKPNLCVEVRLRLGWGFDKSLVVDFLSEFSEEKQKSLVLDVDS